MSVPYRQHVFILLVTQVGERAVSTAIGAVYHSRLDAQHAARGGQYAAEDITVQIVEREVRGEPAQVIGQPA